MRVLDWPLDLTTGKPVRAVPVDRPELAGFGPDAQAMLVDACGMYGLLPKAVVANAMEQLETIKKAEGTKNLWPSVSFRFDQVIPISPSAARVLLEE